MKKSTPTCELKSFLPPFTVNRAAEKAAEHAVQINPMNRPQTEGLTPQAELLIASPSHLAVLTSRYWGSAGVRLTVSFMDNPPQALRSKILSHMNAWGEVCNAKFTETASGGQVRITRGEPGYWSYLGTDVLLVPKGEATMCLEDFTTSTPEAEVRRVVRHETGHTLGFPHEHLRKTLIDRLDVAKTIRHFEAVYGWDESTTRANVLTPLEEWAVMGSPLTDEESIMCYQISGACTKNGKPIKGGTDLSPTDRAWAGQVYPLPPAELTITLAQDLKAGKYSVRLTS